MNTRIDYFEALCQQYHSEILHNQEQQLLLLPFIKEDISFSLILPMQNNNCMYDLLIEKNDKTLFQDSADFPRLGDETDEELEHMFRAEVTATIKELMQMPFKIIDGEIVFQ